MNEIEKKLRSTVRLAHPDWSDAPLLLQAADSIEQLESDLAHQRELVRVLAEKIAGGEAWIGTTKTMTEKIEAVVDWAESQIKARAEREVV